MSTPQIIGLAAMTLVVVGVALVLQWLDSSQRVPSDGDKDESAEIPQMGGEGRTGAKGGPGRGHQAKKRRRQ